MTKAHNLHLYCKQNHYEQTLFPRYYDRKKARKIKIVVRLFSAEITIIARQQHATDIARGPIT